MGSIPGAQAIRTSRGAHCVLELPRVLSGLHDHLCRSVDGLGGKLAGDVPREPCGDGAVCEGLDHEEDVPGRTHGGGGMHDGSVSLSVTRDPRRKTRDNLMSPLVEVMAFTGAMQRQQHVHWNKTNRPSAAPC